MSAIISKGMRCRQRGAATLLVSMVLLIAATLIILYTSQTTFVEQKISANEVRQRQAFSAAQAGIDMAIAQSNAAGSIPAAVSTNALVDDTKGFYQAVYCGGTLAVTALPACPNAHGGAIACAAPASTDEKAWLMSCGWSDDDTARQRIVVYAGKLAPLPNSPTNPLTAKGAVMSNGNPTVINYSNNLTVWTGAGFSGLGNTGKTAIRDPGTAYSQTTLDTLVTDPNVLNGQQVCSNAALYCTSTGTSLVGADVVANDTSLSILDSNSFFANTFGMDPASYKNMMAADNIISPDKLSVDSFKDPGVYWVDGNASLKGGNATIGSQSDPRVVIIDGNLDLMGGLTVYGVVFIRGDWTGAGGLTVVGAMIVGGKVDISGDPTIIYDPKTIGNVNTLSKFATMAGSWRDF